MREKESMLTKLKKLVDEMPSAVECDVPGWQCGVCNRGECYGLTEKCDLWEYRNAQSS